MYHKLKPIKLLGENFHDIRLSTLFLYITPKVQYTYTHTHTVQRLYFINTENFCYEKETLKRI